jgi:hypothetical protein
VKIGRIHAANCRNSQEASRSGFSLREVNQLKVKVKGI